MSQTPPPSTSSARTRPLLLVGLPILAVALAGLALYVALVQAPTRAALRETHELLMGLTGLQQPVINRLGPGFVDANNDLIADPPTDPALLVDPPVLKLSYVGAMEAEEQIGKFRELAEHLERITGREVEVVAFRNAEEQLRALRDGRLHVTAFNTGNVPKAVNTVGFVPVAVPATAEGDPYVRSLLLVAPRVTARTIAELSGYDITLTEPGSNSGFRVPLGMLKGAGLLPARDYNIRYSGGHVESIARLNNSEADVIAVASDVLARELARGGITRDRFRQIAESETFPGASIGYVHNLTPELGRLIREGLLSFPWAGTGLEQALGGGGSARFVPVNYKDDFALVRRVDDDTGVVHKLP